MAPLWKKKAGKTPTHQPKRNKIPQSVLDAPKPTVIYLTESEYQQKSQRRLRVLERRAVKEARRG